MIEHAGTCTISTLEKNEIRFKRGTSSYVYDDEGKRYIDFILGFGPVIIGHAEEEFNQMISRYLLNGIHFPSYSVYHEQFLERLKDTGWSAFSFFKTSSEAITATIRIAMAMTHKKGVVRCGFIGWHDVQIGNTIAWHEQPNSVLRNEVRFIQDFRGISGDENVVNWASFDLDELESTLRKSQYCIFIIDAFQVHYSTIEILQQALKICKKYGVLTVLDETKTSGRVRLMGISEYYGIKTDFLIMGKAIANGGPLSVLCGNNELSDNARVARITGTFSKECIGIYCALATLEIMDRRNGYVILETVGNKFVRELNGIFKAANVYNLIVAEEVFNGSMINLRFGEDIINNKTIRNAFRLCCAENGILLLQGHPSFVCLAHQNLDIKEFRENTYRAVEQWKTIMKL